MGSKWINIANSKKILSTAPFEKISNKFEISGIENKKAVQYVSQTELLEHSVLTKYSSAFVIPILYCNIVAMAI